MAAAPAAAIAASAPPAGAGASDASRASSSPSGSASSSSASDMRSRLPAPRGGSDPDGLALQAFGLTLFRPKNDDSFEEGRWRQSRRSGHSSSGPTARRR